MSRTLAFAALALALVLVQADDVVVLNKENFKDSIGADKLTLVKFFAPWCGHCKNMAQDFKDAATELKGKAVLADVDATVEKELAKEYGVTGFPTLKLFSKGEVIADYRGGRKKDDFVKYIERALLPSIVDCKDAEAINKVLEENKVAGKNTFVGIGLDKLESAFKKLSFSLRDVMPDSVAFAGVPDITVVEDAAKDTMVAVDSVLLVRPDGSQTVYTGEPDDMDAWMKVSALPAIGELSRETASLYTELPKPLFILFKDPKDKSIAKVEEDVEKLSNEMRESGELAFVWINAVDLKSFMEHVGVKEAGGVAIYKFAEDIKYLYEGAMPPTYKSMKEWVDKFVKGEVPPTIKSEPVPEKNDEPVKVVVGDSWKQIVEDESKDVLIEQYAPWCGHCKKLEPVLAELAKDMSGINTLVIAKMDATKNDAPVEYKARGFPTMHFFPAGKTEGITYNGGRGKEDFIKFFKENATHKDELEKIESKSNDTKEDEKDEL